MTILGTPGLDGACITPGCPHRTGRGHFMCRPCWNLVPSDLMTAMLGAIYAARDAVAELREVTA